MMVNSPSRASPLVGRHNELVQLTVFLSDPTCRLLTLVGPGGIGKTRLAIEAARQLPHAQPVHFVALQPLTSPDFLVTILGEALGLRFYGGSEPKQQLLDYLREKAWLLVLDNFEHLLDGATLLSELLGYAPSVRLLVTSRERLHLVEEWVFEVGGLAYPADERVADAEQYGAVELFVQHARRVKTSFHLTEAQRPALARICRLVGGMPLAIELSATWVRALSCEAIAEELGRSLDILETPARNVEERHRTMRATFAPTWAYLSDSERNVFMRLSVFRGGFTRATAEAVAGASLRSLTALVDKSLLRVNDSGRYDLHELLRQYAAEKLVDAGEVQNVARHHAEFFMELAEQTDTHIYAPSQINWLDRLELERDNIRAVLTWTLQNGAIETGLRLASALRPFWEHRNHLLEGIDWLERLVAVTEQGIVAPHWLVTALNRLGDMVGLQRDDKRSKHLALEALALARQTNDRLNIAWALASLGYWTFPSYTLAQQAELLDESLQLFRELADPYGISHALRRRGGLALLQGQNDSARLLMEEALLRSRKAGEKIGAAWALYMLGDLILNSGSDPARSVSLFNESRTLFRQIRDYDGDMHAGIGLARLSLVIGDNEQAETLFREGLTFLKEMRLHEVRYGIIRYFLVGFVLLAARQGLLERAARLLGAIKPPIRETSVNDFGVFSDEVETLRVRLIEPPFAAAWEQGEAMTGEQVFAYLLHRESFPETQLLRHTASQSLPDPLSTRELEVLRLMAEGFSNGEIAEKLVLAKGTVKWHIHQIFSKMHGTTRTQVVALARSLGLLT